MKKIFGLLFKNFVPAFCSLTAFVLLSFNVSAKKIHQTNVIYVDSLITDKGTTEIETVKGAIKILNKDSAHGMVRIYYVTGKRISETILMPGSNTIDLSKLAHDTYFVCITMDGGATYNKKFIKE